MNKAEVQAICNDMISKGRLVESGWMGLRLVAVPHNASPEQLDDMRMAFFAGAAHLFSAIMLSLDDGTEPTDADISKMHLVQEELARFSIELQMRVMPTQGSA